MDAKWDELLGQDLKKVAKAMSEGEVRALVDFYYQIQEDRKRQKNRERAISDVEEPCDIIAWTGRQLHQVEKTIAKILDYYTQEGVLNAWCRSITGIGPIITAGLAAHIDLNKCKTGSSIVRYAGYDPTTKWEKGQKRPWNAALKRLCWNMGECFVKCQNKGDEFYGSHYAHWKKVYQERNETGQYSTRCQEILGSKKIGKKTEAYKAYSKGILPPAHIHSMARRKAITLFLNHYFTVGYTAIHGRLPDCVYGYPIVIQGHCKEHFIPPPKWPFPDIIFELTAA